MSTWTTHQCSMRGELGTGRHSHDRGAFVAWAKSNDDVIAFVQLRDVLDQLRRANPGSPVNPK